MRHSWPVADDVATAWLTVNLPNAFHYESLNRMILGLALECVPGEQGPACVIGVRQDWRLPSRRLSAR